MIHEYFQAVGAMLEQAERTQRPAMARAARLLAQATAQGKRLYAFGCNHAGTLAMELYYRTGGLANMQLISLPGLRLDLSPPSLTSRVERLTDYAHALFDAYPMEAGDVLLIHSVSGKNAVPVEAALLARERGASVIALTNVTLSRSLAPAHPGGKRLFEIADVVIDNCGGESDAVVRLPGCAQRVGASSTAVGAAILNAVVAQTAAELVRMGHTPPILASCNVAGGEEYNQTLLGESQ